MPITYDWAFAAYRRAAINAATSVLVTLVLVTLYLRGYQGLDVSWIVLAGPILLYHAYLMYEYARNVSRYGRKVARALVLITATKIAGWIALAWWAVHARSGWLAGLAIVMLAVKIGELGIYMQLMRAVGTARPEERSGRTAAP